MKVFIPSDFLLIPYLSLGLRGLCKQRDVDTKKAVSHWLTAFLVVPPGTTRLLLVSSLIPYCADIVPTLRGLFCFTVAH